jgi:hypothetical protein
MALNRFVEWLLPLAVVVLIGGWALAVVAFFVIGSETCTTVEVPLAGPIEACTDTRATAVILLTVIGFGATISAVFLVGLRYLLGSLEAIEENTRRR